MWFLSKLVILLVPALAGLVSVSVAASSACDSFPTYTAGYNLVIEDGAIVKGSKIFDKRLIGPKELTYTRTCGDKPWKFSLFVKNKTAKQVQKSKCTLDGIPNAGKHITVTAGKSGVLVEPHNAGIKVECYT